MERYRRKKDSDAKLAWHFEPYLKTAIVVLAAVLVIVLLWTTLGGGVRRSGTKEETGNSYQVSQTQTVAETYGTTDNTADNAVAGETAPTLSAEDASVPEADDGSGNAGITAIPEGYKCTSPSGGWNVNDDGGTWYCIDGGMYCNGWANIDGADYHFDSMGYIDRGWKAIGGKGYYFDENGVNDPNADPKKLIAFTYDDGPSEGTDRILDLCEQYNCHATFFLIGKQVEEGGAVIPRINALGCEVGNHSYSHAEMLDLSPEDCAADFQQCDEAIAAFNNGQGADVIRFPYGDYTKDHTAAVNKPQIYWDIDTFDWETKNKDSIKQEVYSLITGGNFILMHDRYDATVEACAELFPELISQGYQLVTASELAAANGYELQGGVTYYSFKDKNVQEGRVTDESE